jgi:hypothetical protein
VKAAGGAIVDKRSRDRPAHSHQPVPGVVGQVVGGPQTEGKLAGFQVRSPFNQGL